MKAGDLKHTDTTKRLLESRRDDGFNAVRGILVAGVLSVVFYAGVIAAVIKWGWPW